MSLLLQKIPSHCCYQQTGHPLSQSYPRISTINQRILLNCFFYPMSCLFEREGEVPEVKLLSSLQKSRLFRFQSLIPEM
ncbi:unnamed protein product [Linum trigynum]|uniref:Uncharacterized protein n=1 Tax=Linum trigynum TaxID=586398 RepID=A0AAV2G8W5_9ROSI